MCYLFKNQKTNKYIKISIFFILLALLLGIKFSISSHEKISKKIEDSLSKNRKITLKELGIQSDITCILPPYIKPEAINSHLSEEQLSYLQKRVNSFWGLGDHVWWLISLKENDEIKAYRIYGTIRPNIKTGYCLHYKNIMIKINRKSGNYLFLDFSEGE